MTSPLRRLLGAIAGLGSAILFWILGSSLSEPLRSGRLFKMDAASYQLLAFLLVPALILAVVALFWVPPRINNQGPTVEGARLRTALAVVFVGAFLIGIAR